MRPKSTLSLTSSELHSHSADNKNWVQAVTAQVYGNTSDGLFFIGQFTTGLGCLQLNYHLEKGEERAKSKSERAAEKYGQDARWTQQLDSPFHMLLEIRSVQLTVCETINSFITGKCSWQDIMGNAFIHANLINVQMYIYIYLHIYIYEHTVYLHQHMEPIINWKYFI